MVYVVFIHQPYASMTCKGLLPAVFAKLRGVSKGVKVYVYALDQCENATDYPYEWHLEYVNQHTFGNMPKAETLPVNALIGSVTINGTTDVPGLFSVINAREFIAPFEMLVDEVQQYEEYINRMNTRMYIPRVPHLIDGGDNLVIPVNVFLSCMAQYDADFKVELVGSFAKLVLDENGLLKPFTKFTIWYDNEGKSFLVDEDTEIIHELTADGKDLKRYPTVLATEGTTTHSWLHFSCHYPLND